MIEGGDGFLPPASRASATSKKHRCRVCGRTFPSGRSLGGHMRSHVYSSPPSPPADCFDERQGSYSLRENPKKSRRFGADDGGASMQCVECGREFASWKALFGHMRCHTEKGREERDGGSCASNGSYSDSGSRKRTSLWIGEDASASNCSLLTTDGKAEDGAIGLMLLSRGLRHWNGAAAAWGGEECSSDKNWEVLESSDLVPDATEKSGSELGDSRIEFKKVESDDENDGGGYGGRDLEFRRNSFAMDNGGEKRSKFECKSCNKVFDSYQALGGHRASHKRIKGCHDTEAVSVDDTPLLMAEAEAEAEAVRPPPLPAAAKSAKKHQCSICNKLFSSGQALGGHKRSHLAAAGSAPGADAASSMVIPQAQHHEMPKFFDLNDIPSEHSEEVESWWSRGDLNHEMMVGAILN